MKKNITVAVLTLALLILPIIGCAEAFDLSGLSYEELVALKDQINLAMWESEEWEEVYVPQGVYQVGVDIPAGHWTIKATEGNRTKTTWCTKLDASGKNVDFTGTMFDIENIYSPTWFSFNANEHVTFVDYDLKDGQYLIIENGTAIFTPYEGKPDFVFGK